MKLFVVLFAVVVAGVAAQISNEYLPPEPVPSSEYLAPIESEPAHELADDGYRYKTVRRLKYRHRRDVSELPSSEYLPPVAAPAPVHHAAAPAFHVPAPAPFAVPAGPSQEYLPPVGAAPETLLADDGYRYKTVRRLRYRHRRDVSELPSSEYLPPVAAPAFHAPAPAPFSAPAGPSQEYLPPVGAAPETLLADDGYRYKTVRRLRYRHRRDVSELPSSEYLPPVAAPAFHAPAPAPAPFAVAAAPSQEYLPPVGAAPETLLADDGYRYKTVRRLRYRHRRDVSELPSSEYLPPVAAPAPVHHDAAPVPFAVAPVPSQEYLAPVGAAPETLLADDGYRYKTVRRLKYRHRRDVSELPSSEYLPPVAAPASAYHAPAPAFHAPAPAPLAFAPAPSQEYLPPVGAAPETLLADDGYRYKTVRRLRYRHRRDVNELPSSEYLPPVAAPAPVHHAAAPAPIFHAPAPAPLSFAPAPSQEYLPPVGVAPETHLADDGYRYKVVRKLKYRRH